MLEDDTTFGRDQSRNTKGHHFNFTISKTFRQHLFDVSRPHFSFKIVKLKHRPFIYIYVFYIKPVHYCKWMKKKFFLWHNFWTLPIPKGELGICRHLLPLLTVWWKTGGIELGRGGGRIGASGGRECLPNNDINSVIFRALEDGRGRGRGQGMREMWGKGQWGERGKKKGRGRARDKEAGCLPNNYINAVIVISAHFWRGIGRRCTSEITCNNKTF